MSMSIGIWKESFKIHYSSTFYMVLSVPTVEEKLLQERINRLVLNKNKQAIFISHKYVTQRNKGKNGWT